MDFLSEVSIVTVKEMNEVCKQFISYHLEIGKLSGGGLVGDYSKT